MSNVLKKITTEAKRLRKSNPRMTWRDAVKAAGKKYRSGSIRGVRKKKKVGATKIVERGEKRSTRPAKTYQVSRTNAGRYKSYKQIGAVNSVSTAKSQVKSYYKVQLGNLLLKREMAKGARDRKQYTKKIAAVKKTLKHFE